MLMQTRRTPWARKSLFCVVIAISTAPAAWSQASTATVSGVVRDQSGAVIPGATVTLKNTATNVASTTNTNGAGFYMILGVIPGAYGLTAEAAGMQKYRSHAHRAGAAERRRGCRR